MRVSGAAFRDAMRRLASAVTVVTVRAPDGAALGMTASAVCSLSLEPPMVLACVGHEALIHGVIVAASHFGIAVLAEDQEATAVRFADREAHRIGEAAALSPAGLPRLAGALVHLDCRRADAFAAGDHTIVTGVVEWTECRDGRPLLYFGGRYGRTAP